MVKPVRKLPGQFIVALTSVTKQTISRVERSNDVAHYWTGVKANTNVDVALFRLIGVNEDCAGFVNHVNSELRSTFHVVVLHFVCEVGNSHVGITARVTG